MKIIEDLYKKKNAGGKQHIDKELASEFFDALFKLLFFPGKVTFDDLQRDYENIEDRLTVLLSSLIQGNNQVLGLVDEFFYSLPGIYNTLLADASAILQSDPAAESIEEVLVAYPGFYAIAAYRIAHKLFQLKVPMLPRIISEYVHSKTGIDIHPGAKIGAPLLIDHGTGIVIGATVVIGNNVKIYQGVTLGALNVSKELAKIKRHPTIEDNVIIYSGSTILGGDTVVGRHTVIGGNVWLTNSVESHSVVYHKSNIIVKDKSPVMEQLNFVI